ncbi:MAG: hypothetical protein DCF20_10925 [Pseudanabaena sp.]|nr:MAG: hypothetical protein DCF20_10925 [Pseudanabaena sp.]
MFLFKRLRRLIIRFVLISLLAIALVISWSELAHSQLPSLPTLDSANSHKPPSGVTRIGVYEVARVISQVDKKLLFEIVSPTIFNRDRPKENTLPVEVRAEEIMERLNRLTIRVMNSKQTPKVTIGKLNDRPILQLEDDQSSRPLRLVTITEPDADYLGKTKEEVTNEWQKILQTEVNRIDELFSPEVLSQRSWNATQIIIGLVFISLLIWLLRRMLITKQKALQTRNLETQAAASKTAAMETSLDLEISQEELEVEVISKKRSRFLKLLQYQFTLDRQLEIYGFLHWFLFWLFIFLWYVGISFIVSHVPFLMRWSLEMLSDPLILIVFWFLLSLAIRLVHSLTDRLIHAWTKHLDLPVNETQRLSLRAITVSRALKGFTTFTFITLGIVWTLNLFNVPTGSILAGGALIGIAISLGSQSLIKDLVNGCLILIEDQFAVGDIIQIGDKSGLVEKLNLRVTQLRDSQGKLITIRNSNITEVSNLTRLWARVDFSIVVDYDNDPKEVLDVLNQVSQQLYNETEWRDRILNPPEVLGIDELSHNGMLMRVWIQTMPMQQWIVGREFHLRVRQAFQSKNIQIGRPQLVNYNNDISAMSKSQE